MHSNAQDLTMEPLSDTGEPVVNIVPISGWVPIDPKVIWEYRGLLYFLVWRDIKVRYKQTVLGALWALIQPLATMLVFTIFFGRLAKLPSDGIPYSIFTLAALVPWTFFNQALTRASDGLVTNSALLKKVYFPRLAIPLAKVGASLVDFFIAMLLLFVMMPIKHMGFSQNTPWLLVFSLMATAAALGTGLWFSALNVQFRDIGYAVPFLVQIWFFATPVVYSSSMIPERWRLLLGLNPMAGVVEGFRWSMFGTATPDWRMLMISAICCLLLLISGALYFRRMERTFADVV
jgi:lipopolysaccharide transport system permease protein